MGDFTKKKLGLMSWGKNSCTEKKIYLTAYNAAKNMLHHYMSGEKILPPQTVWGEKVLPKPNQIPFNPPSQVVGASGAQSLITSRSSGKRTATRERERKKSRLGQTQFDDFNKCLKYTWFSTYFYWQMSSLI